VGGRGCVGRGPRRRTLGVRLRGRPRPLRSPGAAAPRRALGRSRGVAAAVDGAGRNGGLARRPPRPSHGMDRSPGRGLQHRIRLGGSDTGLPVRAARHPVSRRAGSSAGAGTPGHAVAPAAAVCGPCGAALPGVYVRRGPAGGAQPAALCSLDRWAAGAAGRRSDHRRPLGIRRGRLGRLLGLGPDRDLGPGGLLRRCGCYAPRHPPSADLGSARCCGDLGHHSHQGGPGELGACLCRQARPEVSAAGNGRSHITSPDHRHLDANANTDTKTARSQSRDGPRAGSSLGDPACRGRCRRARCL